MAYKIMKKLLLGNTKTQAELLDMADVYYAVGRLTGEQYTEIVGIINENGINSDEM